MEQGLIVAQRGASMYVSRIVDYREPSECPSRIAATQSVENGRIAMPGCSIESLRLPDCAGVYLVSSSEDGGMYWYPDRVNTIEVARSQVQWNAICYQTPDDIEFAKEHPSLLLYVGASKNLRKRWLTHHRLIEFVKYPNLHVAWMECEPEIAHDLERFTIDWLEPMLNSRRFR